MSNLVWINIKLLPETSLLLLPRRTVHCMRSDLFFIRFDRSTGHKRNTTVCTFLSLLIDDHRLYKYNCTNMFMSSS
jgi:hypothetical protein